MYDTNSGNCYCEHRLNFLLITEMQVAIATVLNPAHHIKVGCSSRAIPKLTNKWATSKSTQVSTKVCIKLLPLSENALKLNFEALYQTENLDPLQGPTHTLTPSSIYTQNWP